MVDSKEILAKAGIGSRRTLIRWHQSGIIPEPDVTTHPSGRGTLSYWPDWVLTYCIKIQEIRERGVSLRDAQKALYFEFFGRSKGPQVVDTMNRPAIAEILMNTGGTDVWGVVQVLVTPGLRYHIKDDTEFQTALTRLRSNQSIEAISIILKENRDPEITCDYHAIEISSKEDWIVAVTTQQKAQPVEPLMGVPLLPYLEVALRFLGKEIPVDPTGRQRTVTWLIRGGQLEPIQEVVVKDGDQERRVFLPVERDSIGEFPEGD